MPVDRATRQAWLIWSTAVVVYIAALFHRTSLGVAGLEAADRFHVGPAALSTFTVLQIGLYAVMQIPTGLLVDRFGPRRMFMLGMALVAVTCAVAPLAPNFALLCVARAVMALGTATAYPSAVVMVGAIAQRAKVESARPLGRLQMANTSAAAVGPVIGGLLGRKPVAHLCLTHTDRHAGHLPPAKKDKVSNEPYREPMRRPKRRQQ